MGVLSTSPSAGHVVVAPLLTIAPARLVLQMRRQRRHAERGSSDLSPIARSLLPAWIGKKRTLDVHSHYQIERPAYGALNRLEDT